MGSLAYAENREQSGDAERDLVRRARDGDREAFAEIVRTHQRRVYGVALRMTRRHEVADDVVQETFLRAYRSLGRFDEERPLGPWLAKIAVNTSINHLKGPARRELPLEIEGDHQSPTHTATSAGTAVENDPLRSLEAERFATALEQAVEQLGAEQRAVLVLKVVEGLRYDEIAASLDISPGTVMSRLSRARAKLRTALSEYL